MKDEEEDLKYKRGKVKAFFGFGVIGLNSTHSVELPVAAKNISLLILFTISSF